MILFVRSLSEISSPPDLDTLFTGGMFQTLVDIIVKLPLIIFPIIIIYGGVMYMMSAGNEQNMKKAQSTLTWGIIGFFITLIAYGLVSLVSKLFNVNIDPSRLQAPPSF